MHPVMALALGIAIGWLAAALRAAPQAKRREYQLALLRAKLRAAGFGLRAAR